MNQITKRPSSLSEAKASRTAQTHTYCGEVIPPGSRCRVVVHNPLQGRTADRYVQAGLSVRETLHKVLECPTVTPLPAGEAFVNGEWIPEVRDDVEWWSRIRLRPGSTLAFMVRPQGSGALRSVLGIALAVAAMVIAPYLAGPALLGFTAGTAAFGIAAGLIGAGVVLAGTMALNALFPTRPAQLASRDDTAADARLNSIQGAQNQAAPFEAIPVVLGRHRQSPFYGAKLYTELVGEDQYLRGLVVWGYGPMNITDLKIGETPIASFSDVQLETVQGYSGDNELTLYPSRADEEALNIALSAAAVWATRTTAPDADVINVEISALEGIFRINSETGDIEGYEVEADIEYRLVGAVDWVEFGNITFYRSTRTSRRGRSIDVARGQYEVRVRKTTDDGNNERIKDQLTWTALRTFTAAAPVTFAKPLAMTAFRIKASNQLSGVIDTLNGVCESIVASANNGAVWGGEGASRNPADLYRQVLQHPGNARPVANAQIDLDNLTEWWAYCYNNGFTFDQVRTARASVYETLADIAAAGRAVPTFIDGKWAVVWDRSDDGIVQHFTPRNSWGFQGERAYVTMPHAFRVGFINSENSYTRDERIVYDDGYDAGSATLFEGIEFPGVTTAALNWKHGRFHIAQTRLRPERITIQTGWDNLVCTRGDRVKVTHDVLLIGQVSGRVKAVDGQVVTLDEVVTIEAGNTYGIRFRVPQDTRTIVRSVDLTGVPPGEYTQLTLTGDLSLVAAGLLFGFGETDQESADYRVLAIAHQKDLIATLTLVDDAPAISEADQGAIPDYNPNVSVPPDPFTLPPRDLRYQELIEGAGLTARAIVRLTWLIPRSGFVRYFEVQQRDDNAGAEWVTVDTVTPPRLQSDVPLISAGIWSYRVRAVFQDNTSSDWLTLATLNLLGLMLAPDDVANFRSTYTSGRIYLTWDVVEDVRGILYQVRKGASWDAGLIVGDAIAQPKFQTVGDDTYLIAAYVTTPFGVKVFSATKRSLTLTGSVLTTNVVVSRDERAITWDGYFGGTVGRDDDENYIRTSGSDNILASADFLNVASLLDGGGQGSGYYYSKRIVDAGRSMPVRISVDYAATAVPASQDFLGNPDLLNDPDFLQSFLTQFIRVYPVIRLGTAADADVYGPADIFAEDDAFAAGITWGAWQKWSPDVYVGRFFQLGIQLDILDATVNAVAYVLAFAWVADVEDRLDRYQDLTIPPGGLVIAFTPTGSETATPFNGGINNEALPHIMTDYEDRPDGYRVVWTALSLASVTVSVKNAADVDVGGTGINVLAQGY